MTTETSQQEGFNKEFGDSLFLKPEEADFIQSINKLISIIPESRPHQDYQQEKHKNEALNSQ